VVVASAAASSRIEGAIDQFMLLQLSRQAQATPAATVPTAAISWDLEQVFPLKGRRHLGIMGRAFDLLPGGTMFSAACIHRGIVGVMVKMISSTKAEIVNFAPIIIARADTTAEDLEPWHNELLEAFHAQTT
jgi:hypothetical protein